MPRHVSCQIIIFIGISSLYSTTWCQDKESNSPAGIRKLRDVVIYEDTMFHAAFPSVIKRRNGAIIVAFRRAPNRKIFGEKGTSHVDANSYLMQVTSRDGISWSKDAKLIYAHPFGGSQDPCLLQLRDG
ncbi:MAG: hypothetical protein WEB30_11310, partial [Cyclobacteriaceae bacterium]